MQNRLLNLDDAGVETILIYDFIGKIDKNDLTKGISGKDLAEYIFWLDEQINVKKIHVRINSSGGIIDDGLKIISAIRQIKKPVYTFIDGVACSMAFVIALCGEKRFMVSYGKIMAHYGKFLNEDYTPSSNEEIGLENYNEIIKYIVEMISPNHVDDILKENQDVWLSAYLAKEYGLINEIIDSQIQPENETEINQIISQTNYRTESIVASHNTLKLHTIYANEIKKEMDAKEILEKITALFSENKKVATIAEDKSLELEDEKRIIELLKKENADLKEKIAEIEAKAVEEAKAIEDSQLETQVVAVVDLAEKDNKITASMKPAFVALGKSIGLEALSENLKTLPVVNPNSIVAQSERPLYTASVGLANVRENLQKNKKN